MSVLEYLIPIVILAVICAAWVVVQLVARKMGTKNHIEHGAANCGQCGCGVCELDESKINLN